jgi:hypothetical protein
MPSDWHLTGVVGGSLTAEGPHGEMLSLGILYQGISNTPTRNAFGGQPQLAYPLSSNLFPAFVSLVNQVRRINHKGPGSYKLISQKQLSSDGGAVPPIQAIFTVDFNDGIGPRKGSARIGAIHVAGLPTWAMSISTSNIPVKYADSENALMQAVIGSCHQNGRVIGAENQAVLDHIKQVGVMTQHNVDSANQRREASTASFNQSMSNQDWSSKVTQNYILDRSVVTNTETGARGTVSNNFADALVKSNPNQFQVVPNQQMIQGRDY